MSTLEIKQELQDIINKGDESFVEKIYEMVLNFQTTLKREKMILEGEEDIKKGNLHSSDEIKNFISNWKP